MQAVKDLDAKLQALSAPRERVMKLLQASDKRATLLQMAGQSLAVVHFMSACYDTFLLDCDVWRFCVARG